MITKKIKLSTMTLGLMFLAGLLPYKNLGAQCLSTNISSTGYFTGSCSQFTFQGAIGATSNSYGSCGNLHFTPPMTGGDIISSIFSESLFKFEITPNPTFDRIELKIDNSSEIEQLKIFSSTGMLVSNIQTDTFLDFINLESLPTGLYYIQLKVKGYRSVTKKFIKL